MNSSSERNFSAARIICTEVNVLPLDAGKDERELLTSGSPILDKIVVSTDANDSAVKRVNLPFPSNVVTTLSDNNSAAELISAASRL